jgi:hypothetical protein
MRKIITEDHNVITVAAGLFLAWGLLGLLIAVNFALINDFSRSVVFFAFFQSSLAGSIGIGLFYHKKWAFFLFKLFLYLLFISIPIGTAISYFTLKSIKQRNLGRFFEADGGDSRIKS